MMASTDDVTVQALEPDDEERGFGIVSVRVMIWGRMTVVSVEDETGLLAAGHAASWVGARHDALYGRALARRKAIEGLIALRERRDRRLARIADAIACERPNGLNGGISHD